jgi:uncharacterized protein (DUF924 family)
MLEKVTEILDFWFKNEKNWWSGTEAFDQEIRTRFETVHHSAAQGKLDAWLELPHTCLAYIILLDQFSRNMYRNTPLAFAQDPLALAACMHGREQKLDKDLPVKQRLFFYMPLEHSENIDDQKLCLALMRQLIDDAQKEDPAQVSQMQQAFDFAQRHYDIIAQFGRFPHRNIILDRESTQDELLFLSLPNSSF